MFLGHSVIAKPELVVSKLKCFYSTALVPKLANILWVFFTDIFMIADIILHKHGAII